MTTPKSVRLTKAHREDTVAAVMRQWEKTNPSPSGGDDLALVREVIGTAAKGFHRPRKPSDRGETETAVYNLLDRTKKVRDAMSDVPPAAEEHIDVRTTENIRIEVRNDEGAAQSSIRVKIPVELADELGIPYYSTTKEPAWCLVGRDPETKDFGAWTPYTHQKDEECYPVVHLATFVHKYNAIPIPVKEKSNVMKRHQRAERERRLWEKQRSQMFEEVRDLLDQFNTTKQLRENWPDIVPYLPPHVADPAAAVKLPVLEVSRLNERLGIK